MNSRSEVWLLIRQMLELGVEARSTRDGLGLVATESGSVLDLTLGEGSAAAVTVTRQVDTPDQSYQFNVSVQEDRVDALAAELVEYLRGKEPPGSRMD